VLQTSRSNLVLGLHGLHGLSDQDYEKLLHNLKHYLELIQQTISNHAIPSYHEDEIRKLGHELTEQSATLLRQERKTVSYIVSYNIIMLIISLVVIFVIQMVLWQYFFRFLIQEITIMEQMIKMVSEGRFREVAGRTFSPHNEIQVAVQAISDMAGELEKREQELVQSGKLASLGVLISGVAHELGNPLNNISLIAQTYLSLYDLLGDEDKKNYMGDVYTQSERIKKIVDLCKKNKIFIIGVHAGGEAARGPAGSDNERMIDAVAPFADCLIVTKDSNKDGRFSKIAEKSKAPLTQVDYALGMVDIVKKIFS